MTEVEAIEQLRATVEMARDLFGEYAGHHLAKSPPDYDKAHRDMTAAMVCDCVLVETLPNPVQRAAVQAGVRSATIDLSEFIFNAANSSSREAQLWVWTINKLTERGFRNSRDLANFDGPTNGDGWWRSQRGGNLYQFNERTYDGG